MAKANLTVPILLNWKDVEGYLAQHDIVEVVRCEYCKHRDPEDKKCDCGHGIIWQLPRDDNWFCADGERRSDAD